MIGNGIIQSPKNVNHQIEQLFDLLSSYTETPPDPDNLNVQARALIPAGLEETLDGFIPKTGSCGTYFDISRYVPLWVIYEKTDNPDKANAVSVFDFLQKYYDWLYCDSEDGAQYLMSENLLNLIDIEKTRKEFYKRFITIYASGLNENVLQSNGGYVSDSAFVDFIKGIRREFYHRKTTIEGIKYFFKTLFSIDEEQLYIYEPKRNIMRLNGGRFLNEKFQFSGSTGDYADTNNLAGSYLNNARFHDNDWIQEYSYLISIGLSADQYMEAYKASAHPAGLRVVFERRITDYIAPDDEFISDLVCEIPVLKNYSAYAINTEYTTPIGTAVNGSDLYGIGVCEGCCGTEYSGFSGPTYYFPNWSNGISQLKFNDINIFDFFNMCLDLGATSPNEELTCTGC